MTDGLHHSLKRTRKKGNGALKNFVDVCIYIGGIAGPIVTVPQLTKIWVERSANGVSFISWVGYLLGAIFWLAYGILHREKPIIFTYGIWVVLDILILLGILTFGSGPLV